MRDLLRAQGHESDLYAIEIDEDMQAEARPFSDPGARRGGLERAAGGERGNRRRLEVLRPPGGGAGRPYRRDRAGETGVVNLVIWLSGYLVIDLRIDKGQIDRE